MAVNIIDLLLIVFFTNVHRVSLPTKHLIDACYRIADLETTFYLSHVSEFGIVSSTIGGSVLQGWRH